ncbi:MAG: 1,4-alpha-glucan branching protein GlgB [Clostridium sp.]|uniref:1,4-alpha-glucan branching protein GlgB n=1 Tax=Clostridium sp. TaxID=1506 RepID=UPI003F2B2458
MVNDYDKYLFHEGKCVTAYNFMGAHLRIENKKHGARFTVWAPNAKRVSIIGSFNNWNDNDLYNLQKISNTGLWSGFFIGNFKNALYKFKILSATNEILIKADPFSRKSELRPNTASIITAKSKYKWTDTSWRLNNLKTINIHKQPMNIYEVHLGSWKKQGDKFLSYRELADVLPQYISEMGYTHVEILPIMEHPLDESWGYQVTGFYSPTSRYGDIDDFKHLINTFHLKNIKVILDWVPGHFCRDSHGLAYFDGSPCFEYTENWKAENRGWGTLNFDLGRPEVRSFLISNINYWITEFHIDGFRMDAVTNMLYLSYDRLDSEWYSNADGTDINYDGVNFFKEINAYVLKKYPYVTLCAEESTTFKNISHPICDGGLGFHFKWNMGWMNDSLKYIEIDPIYRKYHHEKLNFSMSYNYSENFILPLSHDEVVHGKKSLLNKMCGNYFNKFASLRAYMIYKMGHPGKKLLFMGSEFGQFIEWNISKQLDWHLPEEYPMHKDTQVFFKSLNYFYKDNYELWIKDYELDGFTWIDADNRNQSVYSFIRYGDLVDGILIFIINFTPVGYEEYEIGIPKKGIYKEAFNSDDKAYGGMGNLNLNILKSFSKSTHGFSNTIKIKIPPMSGVILRYGGDNI